MFATRKVARIFLSCLLLVGLLAPAATAAAAEPAGLATPLFEIGVIVKRGDDSGAAEKLVGELGGRITHDLSMIGSFSAIVPGWAVPLIESSPHVSWVTPDRVALGSAARTTTTGTTAPPNTYLDTLGVKNVWALKDAAGNPIDGRGIGIAIVDSGLASDGDLLTVDRQTFNAVTANTQDLYGHGSHVAGIAAGSGLDSSGYYKGVAPGAQLIGIKFADGTGSGYESDVVAGLQYVYNDTKSNIRVVNLSVNCGDEVSYHQSGLDAACEILWFNGITVVCSSGNSSTTGETYNTANAAPANDPFVITVGATNEYATASKADDAVTDYSMEATTTDGFTKPEIVAPGSNIISVLSKDSQWSALYPDRVVMGGQYFKASGTSMASPMVAGTVALMLQKDPSLNPDQIKYRLTHAADSITAPSGRVYPYLNAYKAVTSTYTETANTGLQASQLLWTGTDPVTWDSVMWRSVMWRSVSWDSVMWRSVMWRSIMWRSCYWGTVPATTVTTTGRRK